MARVIHTGDTHIGYRQYHSEERRQDFIDAFRQVIEDAISSEVDAVLHAGDLFHDRRPELQDILATIEVLSDLQRAEIPFLAVVGNHEETRRIQWLDLFETLGLAERLDDRGRPVGNVTIYGQDYVPEARRDSLDYEFEDPDTPYTALVSHGRFEPFPYGTWDLEEVLSTTNLDFDAALLGDDHESKQKEINGTWATYCGSTERASADERGARGYNLVTFDGGVQISRRALDTRNFVFIDLELAPDEGEGRVRQRIREENVQDSVIVIRIEGDGDRIIPADLEQFGNEQGALLTRVRDRRELKTDNEMSV
ncbi:MAG: metallophosphoesterase, partial [Halobacteriaceae archaeon]